MTLHPGISGRLLSVPRSQRVFFGVSALIFAAGAALTIVCYASMSKMGEMPMAGGWKMSVVWMRMPGHSWLDGAASFLAMWSVMMVAMMQPVLAQGLWRYRQFVGETGETRLDRLTAFIAAAYFLAWAVVGVAIYPLGVGVAALEMRVPDLARTIPIAIGAIFVMAGAIQFTAWKAKRLACCRESPHRNAVLPTDARTAWRYGLHLGVHCIGCCFNFVMILLSIGIMDLRAMLLVTLAVTVERLAPDGERVSRASGWIIVATGITMIVRAVVDHSLALSG
jgi:predicted metal-binding membrane protein